MPNEIYYRLMEQLDQYSFGYPTTKSGIELKILERLFTEEEAEMFLSLTPQLQTPEEVSQRMGRGLDDVATLLEQERLPSYDLTQPGDMMVEITGGFNQHTAAVVAGYLLEDTFVAGFTLLQALESQAAGTTPP